MDSHIRGASTDVNVILVSPSLVPSAGEGHSNTARRKIPLCAKYRTLTRVAVRALSQGFWKVPFPSHPSSLLFLRRSLHQLPASHP